MQKAGTKEQKYQKEQQKINTKWQAYVNIKLNINGLNTPKKQRLSHWIFFKDPTMDCLHKIMQNTETEID